MPGLKNITSKFLYSVASVKTQVMATTHVYPGRPFVQTFIGFDGLQQHSKPYSLIHLKFYQKINI